MASKSKFSRFTSAELARMEPDDAKVLRAIRLELGRRQAAYTIACRKQRAAYFAWQAAPAGDAGRQIAEYQAASEAMKAAEY